MNNKIFLFALAISIFTASAVFGQSSSAPVDDPGSQLIMAMAAVMSVWFCIAAYLFYIERKLSGIERSIRDRLSGGKV